MTKINYWSDQTVWCYLRKNAQISRPELEKTKRFYGVGNIELVNNKKIQKSAVKFAAGLVRDLIYQF